MHKGLVCGSFVYAVYFGGMLVGKERKKERKKKIEISTFDFPDCGEQSWDSAAIFCLRVAKGFNL